MDFLLAKMAAKSTENTCPYYPMMLKPGTVYVPPPPPPDTTPGIDNTMTSSIRSPDIRVDTVLPVRTRLLPEDDATFPIHESWQPSPSINQNHDQALAIINDDIEVQEKLQIHHWPATKNWLLQPYI